MTLSKGTKIVVVRDRSVPLTSHMIRALEALQQSEQTAEKLGRIVAKALVKRAFITRLESKKYAITENGRAALHQVRDGF